MSASPPVLIKTEPTTVIPFSSSARQKFIKYLKGLAELEPTLIADLSSQDEKMLIETRNSAKLLGKSEWRIHCAIDAEIIRRAETLSGGRGKTDDEGIGKKAVSAKRAKEIGLTPRTIEKNAQIFELMQAETGVLANATLPDKEFFKAALTAVNPESALKLFSEAKVKSPHFKPSDAYRLLESKGLTQKIVKSKALKIVRDNSGVLNERLAMLAHLKATRTLLLKTVIPSCPNKEFALRTYGTDGLIGDLDDAIESMNVTDAMEAMRRAWDLGYRSEVEMSEHTFFPVDVVADTMNKLSSAGEFIKVNRGGKHESAPGSDSQIWHKAGEPLGDDYRAERSLAKDEDDEDW